MSSDEDDNYDDFDDTDVQVTTASDIRASAEQERKEQMQAEASKAERLEKDQTFSILHARIEHEKKQDEEITRLARSGSRESVFQLRKRLMVKRRKALYAKLSPEQRERYRHFMDSQFSKSLIKKLMSDVLGSSKVSDPFAIIMAGIVKIFLGDVIENGLLVMDEWDHSGPLRPIHIREAYRRLQSRGKVPNSCPKLYLKKK